MNTLAVYTSGGDAPGLNAAIAAVTISARRRNWQVVGIRHGLEGLLQDNAANPTNGVVPLDVEQVQQIHLRGGTILGAVNDIELTMDDVARIPHLLAAHGIDAVVAIGGDGTQAIAHTLHLHQVPIVGVPKTIDNDLDGTAATLGFSTAVEFVTDSLDRLRDTADAHSRVMVVEVMGRDAGWIALHGGMAGRADVILIPEIPFDLDYVIEFIERRNAASMSSTMLVVAEGAFESGSRPVTHGETPRLGGIGLAVAHRLRERFGKQVRHVSLGHLLRGGSPVAEDRLHGLRLGVGAVEAVAGGRFGVLVGWSGHHIRETPLVDVAGRIRHVTRRDVTVRTARALGVCLGDTDDAQ